MDFYLSAPKGLFPPEPEHYRGPKLKVAIIGAGLAGMSTAVELLDQGHEVWLFPSILTNSTYALMDAWLFRWIYMSQDLSLVEKLALLWIDVETTLKWDFMFSLVAIIIFSG